MRIFMGILALVGVGLVIGGIATVLNGGPADAHLEYRFSGTVGAVGGVVMIATVALTYSPFFRERRSSPTSA